MSVLERCPSYKESNKGNKQRQGPTLGVRFTEVSVKRESTVFSCFPQGTKRILVTVLDVNDNYPQFENSPYDVKVSEVSRREVTIIF